ncbi:WD domain, G-beta repeat, putative [Trypanosoma equiperdum]|uniref:Uncharacterized protein n=2 Tax=Trypanozoon TaxID=39700 RepID=Q38AV4_TRYB2|nr:hypothetical protein, conserved [Trypanosoma brucei brucei TREU927]EAN78066.1 hypothetical protein, conserved [Trypanosoma brucei brucei TREU927]SCU70412.1 WD domain, G-beta repeat, putative [Trypanosoma equiperdum]
MDGGFPWTKHVEWNRFRNLGEGVGGFKGFRCCGGGQMRGLCGTELSVCCDCCLAVNESVHNRLAVGLKRATPEPLWQPTRLTSPYCILCANGLRDDFYTSCMSWGRESVALSLGEKVLLFKSSSPRESAVSLNLSGEACGYSESISSVAVSQFSDSHCFLGGVNGAVGLYESHGGGELSLSSSFEMPPPLFGGDLASEAAFSGATTSIRCLSTTNVHPWVVAAGTAAHGLFVLDSRFTTPAARMCGSDLWNSVDCRHSQRPLYPSEAISLLSSLNGICGVSWNSSGSLVATGESGGLVNIWSLSNTRSPVQRIRLPSAHTTVKAVAFHPTNPYELVLGGAADDGCVRVYDVSSATPHYKWGVSTGCQVTQALYSPDGSFIVSAHGARLKASVAIDAASAQSHATRAGVSRTDSGGGGWGAGDELQWLTEKFERAMKCSENAAESSIDTCLGFNRASSSGLNEAKPLLSEAPPFSLVMWRKGTQHQGTTPMSFTHGSGIHHQCAAGSPSRRCEPLPLVSMYTMMGHRSRPLQLAVPFSQTADQGCIASIAGGADCTIRFWKCFYSRSEMVNWGQRVCASLRTAITEEDVEEMTAMPLR